MNCLTKLFVLLKELFVLLVQLYKLWKRFTKQPLNLPFSCVFFLVDLPSLSANFNQLLNFLKQVLLKQLLFALLHFFWYSWDLGQFPASSIVSSTSPCGQNWSISRRLFIPFLICRNRDLGDKQPSNNLFNWISKYRHSLFRISR